MTNESLNLFFLTTSPKEHEELKPFIRDTLHSRDDRVKVAMVEEQNAEAFAAEVRREMEKHDVIKDDEFPF